MSAACCGLWAGEPDLAIEHCQYRAAPQPARAGRHAAGRDRPGAISSSGDSTRLRRNCFSPIQEDPSYPHRIAFWRPAMPIWVGSMRRARSSIACATITPAVMPGHAALAQPRAPRALSCPACGWRWARRNEPDAPAGLDADAIARADRAYTGRVPFDCRSQRREREMYRADTLRRKSSIVAVHVPLADRLQGMSGCRCFRSSDKRRDASEMISRQRITAYCRIESSRKFPNV